MATLLHIFAHPQPEHSQTLRIADAFLESYRATHPNDTIDVLDLYKAQVPHLSQVHLAAMYYQGDRSAMPPELTDAWQEILDKITHFTAADKYLVACPMWNFGVPSIMKAYIDHIVLAGYTFRYTGPGSPEGMMGERPMVIVSARGGSYSQPPMQEFEMCVRYLCNVFDFLGVDVKETIINEGMALVGPHEQDLLMQPTLAKAREIAATF
jgi:FMN-dependent NADH-azoreductase